MHHDRIGSDLVGVDMMVHPVLRTMDLDYGRMLMVGIAGTVTVAPAVAVALADMLGVVGAGLDRPAVDVDNEVSDEARVIIDWGNLVPANKGCVSDYYGYFVHMHTVFYCTFIIFYTIFSI